MTTREQRDQLLEDLSDEVERWAKEELEQIEQEVELSKQILRARSGTERVELKTINRLSALHNLNAAQLLGSPEKLPTK